MNNNNADALYVKNIRGLMVGRNSNFNEIAKRVDEFVEAIPKLTETIRENTPKEANKIDVKFTSAIKEAISMLDGVKALWLKNDGEALYRVASGFQHDFDMCKKLLPPFVANLLSLSISMQTAKNGHLSAVVNKNHIEILSDTVKNLSAVKELMENAEFAYAVQILEDMTILDSDKTAQKLIAALRNNQKADDLADELISDYDAKITRLMNENVEKHYSVMLVDDRPEILETVVGYLRDAYKVFPLTKGTLALKALEKQKINLFILDIDMPDMDGITLANKIRALPEYKKTPIIILTGNASREYVLAAMRAGANDFLIKPANRALLVAKIADFLKAEAAEAA